MNCRVAALLFLFFLPPVRAGAGEDVWTGVDRVVAVGDVHGDHDQFVAVLRAAGLIDDRGKWSGGKAHLVQTGDVLDRGPDSRKTMDLLMRLEEEARSAGGDVHALIGNHEAMILTGDFRYLAPGEIAAFRDVNSENVREELYQEHQKSVRKLAEPGAAPKFDDAYRQRWEAENPLGMAELRRAFGPAGTYGKWIRGHNAVIRIDGTLFLHGGISPKLADWTVRRINEQVRLELQDLTQLQGGLVMDDNGPLWYRGLALRDQSLEPHVQTILQNFKIDRIAIGHTYTEGTIIPRFGGKVLQIDIGLCRLYDPNLRNACLEIERGKPRVLHRGKRLELPSDSGRDLLRYFKEAAALDPTPSPLTQRIAELETQLLDPAKK
jgi:calcineurin-like phosphoesterase family protein